MMCHSVRQGPCGARRDRGLRQGGSRHERQAGAYALRLSRAHVHMRDGDGEKAKAAALGKALQRSLHAMLKKTSSLVHPFGLL
jgi:hypothetical protein